MNTPFRNSREKIICEHCKYNIVNQPVEIGGDKAKYIGIHLCRKYYIPILSFSIFAF